jgi:phosphoglycolate phosphatase-like HAD superfamily hydrolase
MKMFLPNTRIEVIHTDFPRGTIRAVLFDFDGTLSLIREGWPDVMIPMMVAHLARTPTAESRDELARRVEEFVMRLNGKQTIYQMMQLADEVRKRGGAPREPLEYKHEYHDLLWQRIAGRVSALVEGTTPPELMTVPGSRQLLERLSAQGVPLYLASGTDLHYVQNEVRALDLDRFFGEHVYGAIDDYENFSKKMVIERLVRQLNLNPGALVAFGDGFVEIEEVKRAGGIAVGVASDEKHRTGIDEWKRSRLIQAGADIIVPDYRELDALLGFLRIEEQGVESRE